MELYIIYIIYHNDTPPTDGDHSMYLGLEFGFTRCSDRIEAEISDSAPLCRDVRCKNCM